MVTLVIQQFRSETESKYVLCLPTESDHELQTVASRSHSYKMTVIPPQDNRTQSTISHNPDFLPSDETSPDNLPSEVLYHELKPTPKLLNPGARSTENPISEEPLTDPVQLHDPVVKSFEGKYGTETLSANNSFNGKTMVSYDIKDDDATRQIENVEYPSDDDDLVLKVG